MHTTLAFADLHLEGDDFTNPRLETGLETASIEELADDIAERGLLYPLLVWKDKNIILGGQRRFLAIQKLIDEGRAGDLENEIPCTLYDAPTLEEAKGVALADGLLRKQLSSYEIAQAISRMDGTQVEIGRRIGKTGSYVSQMLKAWNHAGPALHIAWRNDQLKMSLIRQIADLPQTKQPRAVAAAIMGKEIISPVLDSAPTHPVGRPKGTSPRPSISIIKQIVRWTKYSEPTTDYEKGLADMAKFVATGEAPKDGRWSEYLEEESH